MCDCVHSIHIGACVLVGSLRKKRDALLLHNSLLVWMVIISLFLVAVSWYKAESGGKHKHSEKEATKQLIEIEWAETNEKWKIVQLLKKLQVKIHTRSNWLVENWANWCTKKKRNDCSNWTHWNLCGVCLFFFWIRRYSRVTGTIYINTKKKYEKKNTEKKYEISSWKKLKCCDFDRRFINNPFFQSILLLLLLLHFVLVQFYFCYLSTVRVLSTSHLSSMYCCQCVCTNKTKWEKKQKTKIWKKEKINFRWF